MGVYVIAESNALVDKEVFISNDNEAAPHGLYKGERFDDLKGVEYEDKAQSLLNQVVAKHPQKQFSLTEDGQMFGLELPKQDINNQFTVIPRVIAQFNQEILSGMPDLPSNGIIKAHGLGDSPVEFPVFQNDPSAFLPEHMKAVTVRQAKNALRKHVYEWTEEGQEPMVYLPHDFNDMEPAERAQVLINFMGTYERSPIMPAWINKTLQETVKHPPHGMSAANFTVALVGYLGHYAGEEMEDVFLKSTLGNSREDRLHYSDIQSLTVGAGQVFNKQDKAIQQILSNQEAAQLTSAERIAELGVAMHQMGLDSDEVHTLAHRSGFASAQRSNTVEHQVTARPRIA